ncbi:hypothetical protein BGZ95_006051 [Linnemannia exigua]|uniref:Uncharacterized protein n=1 Tax=Linnemannia exigua TaxID=604196 RepID=A0AAD4H8T7_9FUNG|nr:hypothetical protein BGZ95_006051 [Linnemannia exigua]
MGNMLQRILPDFSTQDGLRQYQLTVLGFVLIHGFLHTALFMDGMISHLFFALEAVSLIYIYFFAADYTARPISKLRNKALTLLVFAALWATQHLLLPLQGGVPLFSSQEILLEQVTKTLRQNAVVTEDSLAQEQDTREVDGKAVPYTPYATQMATFMGGIAGLGVFIAGCMAVEALYVLVKYSDYAQYEKEKKAKDAVPAPVPTPAATTATKKEN